MESCKRTVKLDVPDCVGTPEISPDDAFKLNPAGNAPDVTDQEYGGVPPLAVKVAE